MKDDFLKHLIAGCRNNDAASQKALFVHLYDYGMSIAARYGNSLQDAEEITNDAFYKILKHINTYKETLPFKLWVRRIIINTGIDFYRKQKNRMPISSIPADSKIYNKGEEKLNQQYLLKLLNQLSPQYKMVFMLHVIDGYTHVEISKRLNISIGTSKSNLSKARTKLKNMLAKLEINEHYG